MLMPLMVMSITMLIHDVDPAVGDDNDEDDDDGNDGGIMREMSTTRETTMAATLPISNSCYLVSNGHEAGQLAADTCFKSISPLEAASS